MESPIQVSDDEAAEAPFQPLSVDVDTPEAGAKPPSKRPRPVSRGKGRKSSVADLDAPADAKSPKKRAKKRKAEEAAVGTREEAEAEPEDEAEDGEGRDGYTLRGHTLRPQDIERITLTLAKKLAVRDQQVKAAVKLMDDGATVPFIARYRREQTQGLEAATLREMEVALAYLRDLQLRKQAVLHVASQLGRLTPKLEKDIEAAESKTRLEDLYAPIKPKRTTKAGKARDAGLEPLAMALLGDPRQPPTVQAAPYVDYRAVPGVEAALEGAQHILVDLLAEDPEVIGHCRKFTLERGQVHSTVVKAKVGSPEAATYAHYFEHREPLASCAAHRALAMLRGQHAGVLKVAVLLPDPDLPLAALQRAFSLHAAGQPGDALLLETASLAAKKMMARVKADALRDLKKRAQTEAIRVFSKNLHGLLMSAPAGPKVTMGLDPGLRTGTKVAVVDRMGGLVATDVVHVAAWATSLQRLAGLCRLHAVELVSLGDGTGSREVERLVRELARQPGVAVAYVRTSEAGASVYSASELAEEELPGVDIVHRSAASIARRLQDPLAEYVKVPPRSLGLGQYQHDVDQKQLAVALDAAVEDCVNAVGVHLNTASPALLKHVSGLNATHAANVVAYRQQHGPFRRRQDLLKVPRLGPVTFERAAGFLRILDGEEPLDATGVHPERYGLVRAMAEACGVPVRELLGNKGLLARLDLPAFLEDGTSMLTLQDVAQELEKPGRDPRPTFQAVQFSATVNSIEDVEVGMVLPGTVTNVANFGAFVDVGIHTQGLVHVSEMAIPRPKDPHDVVAVGQAVRVRVVGVELARKRVSLSLLGTEPAAPRPSLWDELQTATINCETVNRLSPITEWWA